MSSFNGTIVRRKANLLIPEAYTRILLAKHSTYISTAVVQKDNKLVVDGIMNPSMDDVNTAQELYKDRNMVLFFATAPKEMPEESAQPFILHEADDDHPLLVAFMEGEFSNYADPKSAHAPAYFAYNKYFKPKIDKWAKKGGIENVLEELRDNSNYQDFRNAFMARGNIMFVPYSGDPVLIQNKNPDYKQYPWGDTTNAYGYVEEAPKAEEKKEEAAPVLKKKKGWWASSKVEEDTSINTEAANDKETPQTSGETFSETAEVEAETIAAGLTSKKGKEPEATPEGSGEEGEGPLIRIMWKPNLGIGRGKNDTKKQYDEAYGVDLFRKRAKKHYPDAYKRGTPMELDVPASELQDYLSKGWYLKDAPGKVIADGKKETTKTPDKKLETVHVKPEMAKPIAEEDKKKGYEAFSDPSLVEVRKFFTEKDKSKFINTAGSKELSLDPASYQSLENPADSASQRAGIDFETLLGVARPGLEHLNRVAPDWFIEAFEELRVYYIRTLSKDDKPKPTKPATVSTEEETSVSSSGLKRKNKAA